VSRIAIKRALISVYDKTGLDRLASALHKAGVEIVSTGSTAEVIRASGAPVTPVDEVTGFPECLGGRVKTLHPAVHAGLLADVGNPEHAAQLERLAIAPFQLLVSNLYPFTDTIGSGASAAECIEQIDIGGPAMVRAAAKNHANVAVVTSPVAYELVERAVAADGFTLEERRELAAEAFAHTARYDAAVASWFASAYATDEVASQTGWPATIVSSWQRADVLRYGENPHQRAALYLTEGTEANGGVATAEQLAGKAMSYNNYVDADAAWRTVAEFSEPCVAIMKHSNPCGIALASDIASAHRKAHACDPVSAFGGVIAANRPVTAELAGQIAEIFTEVVVAPDYEAGAVEILARKKNQRLLRCLDGRAGGAPDEHRAGGAPDEHRAGGAPDEHRAAGAPDEHRAGGAPDEHRAGGAPDEHRAGGAPDEHRGSPSIEWRQIGGGLLMQTADTASEPGDRLAGWRLAAGQAAADDVLADLEFAWRACRSVKSNAILLASGRASVGIGMGQVNRVDAARLAVVRAGGRAAGSVAASDAYFPFPDGLQVLAEAGVRAVAEPGGSVRDEEVIAAANSAGVSLYFTGVRHFWH
jgi:phosphoribosylaminoimidazolecarboxamide formyltransferase / IMP cyclohydrolase